MIVSRYYTALYYFILPKYSIFFVQKIGNYPPPPVYLRPPPPPVCSDFANSLSKDVYSDPPRLFGSGEYIHGCI